MTIRDELLAILRDNGSVVVSGVNEATTRVIAELVHEGLIRDEDDPRGCALVITRRGLEE